MARLLHRQKPKACVEESYEPVVKDLKTWITSDESRRKDFKDAIATARSHNTTEMQNIHSLEDYLQYLNHQLHWIPSETVRPKDLLFHLVTMWFVLDQPSVIKYQSPIRPFLGLETQYAEPLTWLSAWMVRFSNEIGKFMDTPASAVGLDTFKSSPLYNMDDYIEPRKGWRTFNEFFCRHVKPGRRPIAAIGDDSVLTSPADCQFKEAHNITAGSTVTTKGLTWPITQMLVDSPYKDRFANGVWLHGFLNVDDYHRIHTPVSGTVLEARTIIGQNYMQVAARSDSKTLSIPNEMGYQFCQSRGLFVIDTGAGLVAVLPVGMAIVSSVILTAEVGTQLHKGEELGYFQFGGSDVVLIFESRLNVQITMEQGRHYQMGSDIGRFDMAHG
ncbi:phosphatidylserine decarboxylase-domain-containing protein [Aspergillus cavernicola]|uniref:Phosphatidylserine decarboxylase-domain-containing protein n=1 Tax=Aspergillus cavernicola TaxID=176166 RepID=A0ABR4IHK3_9EURO